VGGGGLVLFVDPVPFADILYIRQGGRKWAASEPKFAARSEHHSGEAEQVAVQSCQ